LKIGEQLREHRDKAMLTQDELGKMAELSGYTISRIESDQVEPRVSTMRKIAGALGIKPEELAARPKDVALHSPEPSMRDELPEEWRLRQLRVIESSAGAMNDLFASEVERGEFGAEEYDRVGRAFEELDAALEAAMSNKFRRDEEAASEEEREAVNRAWGATMALQNTLGRAYLALRAAADVADLAEYRRGSHTGVDARSA